jgi:glycosyltransferase involved in cell wall biosynthesis
MIGGTPPPIGGTTILFKDLVDRLSARHELLVQVIDTSRPKGGWIGAALIGMKCIAGGIWNIPRATVVSFHSSMQGAIFFGPILHVLCRFYGKKWIFRGFGGQYESWFRDLSLPAQWILRATIFRADVILFERMSSVEYFRSVTDSPLYWYPNSRKPEQGIEPACIDRQSCRRFVYVGHVKPSKGIKELIDAAKSLVKSELIVDVYGPLQEGVSETWFEGSPVRYCGVLSRDQVMRTLVQYDALILPTYWEGEGHPGVILEAYCAGIPVIATRWGGIPEIVDSETGILVEPRDVEDLSTAIRCLIESDKLLARLRNGARSKAAKFDADRWTQYFIDLCHRLATN